jgi:diketogulonate reductase-like aldo/keto reductase
MLLKLDIVTLVGTFAIISTKFSMLILLFRKDTARVYKNEAVIGRALKDCRISRSNVFVTSKLSPADHGYQPAREAFLESLDDLGLDYVDMFLIHWPAAQGIPMFVLRQLHRLHVALPLMMTCGIGLQSRTQLSDARAGGLLKHYTKRESVVLLEFQTTL